MIKFTLAGLEELGFSRDQVYTTLELRMNAASESAAMQHRIKICM